MVKILIILLLCLNLKAISTDQKDVNDLVKKEAYKYTKYKTLMSAICLTESSLGLHILGDDDKSLGIFQFQLSTVRDMVRLYPKKLSYIKSMTDRYIKTKLLVDKAWSTKLACLRFEYYLKRYGLYQAISRHNGGKNNLPYYKQVMKNMKVIKNV